MQKIDGFKINPLKNELSIALGKSLTGYSTRFKEVIKSPAGHVSV
jgi:hypothetical protein